MDNELILLNESFLSYLNNTSNYSYIISHLHSYFSLIYNNISNSKNLPKKFQSNLSDYPKYPYRYRIINQINTFNQNLIKYDILSNDIDFFIDSVADDILYLKINLDKIPEEDKHFKFDLALQKTYFETFETLFNFKTYYLNYYNITLNENFIDLLIGPEISINDNNDILTSFYTHVPIYYFLSNYISKSSNIISQFSQYLLYNDIINNNYIKNSFQNFINSIKNDVCTKLTYFLFFNIYNFIGYSDNITKMILKIIKNSISDLPNILFNYSNFKNTNHIDKLLMIITKYINHLNSTQLLKDIINNEETCIPYLTGGIINSSKFGNIDPSYYFVKIVSDFINDTNENNIRSYMYLAYIYRYYPFKYLNILSIILRNYIENKIIKINDNYITYDEINELIRIMKNKFLENSLNNSNTYLYNFYNYINNNYNINYVYDNWVNFKGSQFTILSYFIDFFEEWINSDCFNTFIETMLYNVFKTLNKNGYIEYNFNWYQKVDLIKLFFKSLFRKSLTDGTLFNDISNEIDNHLSVLKNNSFETVEEILSVDNCNELSYITKHQFDPNTLKLYFKNNDKWIRFYDFNTSPKNKLITLYYVPGYDDDSINDDTDSTSGSASTSTSISTSVSNDTSFNAVYECTGIKVIYDISYPINYYDYDYNKFKDTFDNFFTSEYLKNNILEFYKNLILGTVSKQITYNILDYYSL